MGYDCAIQVIEHRTFLQPQGLYHGQHPLHEPTPRRAVATKGILATARPSGGCVPHGCSWARHLRSTRTTTTPDTVPRDCEKGRRLGIRAGATLTFPTKVPSDSLGWIVSLKRTSDKSLFPMALGSCGHRITHQLRPINMNGRSILAVTSTLLQNTLEFACNRIQPGLQPRSVQFAAAERPPVGEQAFHDIQTHPANCFSGSSSIDQLLESRVSGGPNRFGEVQRQLVVDRPAVATDDAGDRLAQQGLKAREISPEVNHEKGHCRGRRAPEPRLSPFSFQLVSSVFFTGASRTAA